MQASDVAWDRQHPCRRDERSAKRPGRRADEDDRRNLWPAGMPALPGMVPAWQGLLAGESQATHNFRMLTPPRRGVLERRRWSPTTAERGRPQVEPCAKKRCGRVAQPSQPQGQCGSGVPYGTPNPHSGVWTRGLVSHGFRIVMHQGNRFEWRPRFSWPGPWDKDGAGCESGSKTVSSEPPHFLGATPTSCPHLTHKKSPAHQAPGFPFE